MNDTSPLWHDPIVAEIHAIREQLMEQYHGNLVKLSQVAEEHSRALGFKTIESPRFQPPHSGGVSNATPQTLQ